LQNGVALLSTTEHVHDHLVSGGFLSLVAGDHSLHHRARCKSASKPLNALRPMLNGCAVILAAQALKDHRLLKFSFHVGRAFRSAALHGHKRGQERLVIVSAAGSKIDCHSAYSTGCVAKS
jgi:hypothetical protein